MIGGLVIATLGSIQFSILLILQHNNILQFLLLYQDILASGFSWINITYKIAITTAASYAVALLTGLLVEQNRRTQKELKEMEVHLKRVEKMAYMGEMAAGLAHEIKNPMASLVGSIQMLKDEFPYDRDHERLMEIILRETDRLSTLVNDFLFFARPPAGKPQKIYLKTAIEEIVALFEQDQNHAKRITLLKNISNIHWVVIDPAHLRQVVWNLLLNAAEALRDEGVIQIETKQLRSNEISMLVKDNGCGMTPEVMQAMFDPFFTTKSEGTGLGLSIVHRILEAYGSRLEVETALGAGTTVSFKLPLATQTD
jgi:two-component system sensor histidine kinase PilS (NtrC family)